MRPRTLLAAGGLALALGLAPAAPAAAAQTAAQRLVATYAPITNLRTQEPPPCDTDGEQYLPTTVDTVLGNPRVKLKLQPKGVKRARTVTTAPTAADVAFKGSDYFLDLPGDPLNAGCTFGRDFARLVAGGKAPAVTYAHIAREPGRPGIAVQYWFFWYFNEFNDLHEGDWEGMQVVFDEATTPAEALASGPDRIAVFQHAGGQVTDWDGGELETDGTHPVVYPAAGSHATYLDSGVYLGNGQGGSGLGCDNTAQPVRSVRPRAILMPDDPGRRSPFAWLTFLGRWGQREAGYNNGPQGPITKQQWFQPFTWMDGLRSHAPRIPGGSFLGPTITGAFCGVARDASSVVNLAARTILGAALLVLFMVALVAVPAVATRWRPAPVEPLRQRRRLGQLLVATGRLYRRHWRSLVPIGLSAVPIIGAVSGLEWLIQQVAPESGTGRSVVLDIATTVGTLGRFAGGVIFGAVVIAYVRSLDAGEEDPTALGAARGTAQRFWRVVGAEAAFNVATTLIAITIIGLPFAAWAYVRWQFVQQEVMFQNAKIRQAFRGSWRLSKKRWWKTASTTAVLWFAGNVPGPAVGLALLFTDLSLWWINLLGAAVYALLIPYVAAGRTLLYLDLQGRRAEAAAAESEAGAGEAGAAGADTAS
ncbi:MAG: hypothetical protein U0R70_13660 [Solirubrobacteraceae bacterium]